MTSAGEAGVEGRVTGLRRKDIPCIHAVTNDQIATDPDFPRRAGIVMHALGARGAVHLRAHRQTGRRLHDLALTLAQTQRESGAWLVVNDRVDVALVTGARGVQLTSRSMTVRDARAIAPALSVGASVHLVEEAADAGYAGADWAVAGHVFETRSHPASAGGGLEMVRRMALTGVPVIAIGGVLPSHLPALRAAGAHGIAAIRGIWDAADAERAAIAYLTSYDAYGGS